MDEQITNLIIEELGKHHSRNEIIRGVCERAELNWAEATKLIEQVEEQNRHTIATRQSPIFLFISIGTIIGGLALLYLNFQFFIDFFQSDVLERVLVLRTGYYKIAGLVTGLGMLSGGIYGFWKTLMPLFED
jgi:hypothetical protein